ncbi:MAG: hypothetical protein KF835_12350 [Xanthobacteraceae bacterium]|nr:hypothetical protein [Xanthobacteraceae bacterium]
MNRKSRVLLNLVAASGCVLTAACAHLHIRDSNLVSVSTIIGSLKCAFAEALLLESKKGHVERLHGRVASGTLTLKIVDEDKVGASVKAKAVATGPFVFSFAGGTASIIPSFSTSNTRTDTIETKISFRYLLSAQNDDACDLIPEAVRAKYGFSSWLASTIAGLDFNVGVQPRGQIDQLEYTGIFGVVATDSFGLDFDVVFLSGSISDTTTRNDVQTINFKIAPISKANPGLSNNNGGPLGPANPFSRRRVPPKK